MICCAWTLLHTLSLSLYIFFCCCCCCWLAASSRSSPALLQSRKLSSGPRFWKQQCCKFTLIKNWTSCTRIHRGTRARTSSAEGKIKWSGFEFGLVWFGFLAWSKLFVWNLHALPAFLFSHSSFFSFFSSSTNLFMDFPFCNWFPPASLRMECVCSAMCLDLNVRSRWFFFFSLNFLLRYTVPCVCMARGSTTTTTKRTLAQKIICKRAYLQSKSARMPMQQQMQNQSIEKK